MGNTFSQSPGIDLVIPFRNERERLPALERSLEKLRHYPDDECFLVDDCSEDGGAALIHESGFIQVLTPGPDLAGSKKKALSAGINVGNNELILTSDADCSFQPEWMNSMREQANQEVQMLVGPVLVRREKGFLKGIQHTESVLLMFITRATARAGVPLLCSGANLLFRRDAFEAVGGYSSHLQRSSGDDVLLMASMLKLYPQGVRFADAPQALVYTQPVETWQAWFNQRLRWISKTGHVGGGRRMVISLLLLLELILPFLLIPVYWPLAILLIVTEYVYLLNSMNHLGIRISLLQWLLFRTMYPFLCSLLIAGRFIAKPRWKGRKVI